MVDPARPLRTHDLTVDMLRQLAVAGSLYVVVDACNAPLAPRKVMELGPERGVSLYRGTAEEQYWDVAPYLLATDEPTLEWILSATTKGPWGIFAACKGELQALRHHFRHFLRVQLPDGSNSLFRFYDPRVLKPFLESCSEEDLSLFFGPVFAFATIDPDQNSGVFYYRRSIEQLLPSPPPVYPLAFRLTQEHIDALKPQADLAKVDELIDFLKETNNEWIKDIPDDVLRKRVLAGLLRLHRARQKLGTALKDACTFGRDDRGVFICEPKPKGTGE